MNNIQKTHRLASERYVGKVIKTEDGESVVKLKTTREMTVDEYGLIHGGFVFGLADYAAMLAVNEPTVVLGKAETKFIKPVKIGDELFAEAKIIHNNDNKKVVFVKVSNENDENVFEGNFYCYVLKKHVLE